MSKLEEIKAALLIERRAKVTNKTPAQAKKVDSLIYLLNVAINVGQNDKKGKRESTDAEVIQVCKKQIIIIEELLAIKYDDNLFAQKAMIEAFLPTQLSDEQLINVIANLIGEMDEPNIGKLMGALKRGHAGLYDGAMAKNIIMDMLP